MRKYGVFSGPFFPVFGPNAGKYEPEKTPYLHTFHAVTIILIITQPAITYSKLTTETLKQGAKYVQS